MTNTSLSARYDLQGEVNNASLYLYPMIMTLSLSANIVNICVLCRRNLRSASCTHYFLAFSVSSLVYTCEVPLMMFLRLRIGFAVTSSSVGCPLQTFVVNFFPLFVSLMLVLASIDRNLVSSPSAKMRHISQVYVSQRILLITTISTVLYTSPLLFLYRFNSNNNQCLSYSSPIALVYLSSRIVLLYIVIPLAMTMFGLLTIQNIQTLARRIAPIGIQLQRRNRYRRTDGQLARMLLIQVGAYLVFSVPAGVANALVTFIPSMNTSFMVQMRIIFSLWQQSIYFLPFFLNILSASLYRQELHRIFIANPVRNQFLHQMTHFIRTHVA